MVKGIARGSDRLQHTVPVISLAGMSKSPVVFFNSGPLRAGLIPRISSFTELAERYDPVFPRKNRHQKKFCDPNNSYQVFHNNHGGN